MTVQPLGEFKKLDNILGKKRTALGKLKRALKNMETTLQNFNNLFPQLYRNK